MEYINLTITELSGGEYRMSTFNERGIWLTLLAHCVQQENRGVISGAAKWTDWACQQVLRIPQAELAGEHLLWQFFQDDLKVFGYPLAKQKEVQAKRKAGRDGGLSRAASSASSTGPSTPSNSASSTPSSSASSSATRTASTERKGKEGKGRGIGKEGELELSPLPPRGRMGRAGSGLIPSAQAEPLRSRLTQLGNLFKRRPSTSWTGREAAAVDAAGLAQSSTADFDGDLMQMTAYYRAKIPRENDFRRRDLQTLLNNWPSELDRARAWIAQQRGQPGGELRRLSDDAAPAFAESVTPFFAEATEGKA